jgi:hypothetical protein
MNRNTWLHVLGPLYAFAAASALLLLAACGGGAINPSAAAPNAAPNAAAPGTASTSRSLPGVLHGGQSPITGSTLTLYAAGVPASAAPTTLATAYTDGNGNFNFQYTCPSPTSLIYVVASGGNAGGGANPAIELMAALGPCSALPPFIVINELTTVAAVYALNAFSTVAGGSGGLSGCVDCTANADADMTQLHGNAPAINNSFATAALLANAANGEPGASLPPATSCTGTGAPVNCSALGRLTALANSIAACVNSAGGSTQCTDLLNVYAGGSDTLRATLFIARNPGLVNMTGIYGLSTPNKVFSPGLSAAPSDWTIALNFSVGGLNSARGGIAIDGSGDVWVSNSAGNSVIELSPTGSALSPAGGFTGGGLNSPSAIAIDASGKVWVTNSVGNSVSVLSPTGSALSPASGFTGGGLNVPDGVAIDASGNVWVADGGAGVTELSPNGSALSPANGFRGGGLNFPDGIAIDGSGNVWVASTGNVGTSGNGSVTELAPTGSALSPASGFTGGGLSTPTCIAINSSGNVWVGNAPNIFGATHSTPGVTELNPTGSALSPVNGFTGGGLNGPFDIAIDGSGNVWVVNFQSFISELNPTGSALSPASGFTGGGLSSPWSIAIDGSGNVWVANLYNSVTEVIGAAAPTVTPMVAQIINKATLLSIAVTPQAPLVNSVPPTEQFTATGTYSDAATANLTSQVTWSSSNSTVASITPSAGLATCITSGEVSITASLTLNNGTVVSGTTALNCDPPVVSIAVSPITASIAANAQQQFSAIVSNSANTAVTWSVVEPTGGSITQGGLYTAPNGGGTFHVLATLNADSSITAEATVNVSAPPPISISLTPLVSSIAAGAQQQFSATVSNSTNTAVTWSVVEPTGGSITTGGLYTAPNLGGTFHVLATANANSSVTAEATVNVLAP